MLNQYQHHESKSERKTHTYIARNQSKKQLVEQRQGQKEKEALKEERERST